MTLMHLMPRRLMAAHHRWSRLFRVLAATVAAFFSALNPALVYANDIPDDLQIDLSSIVVSKDELICLALNDYWEARSEVIAGRIAVARVVLNRAMDPRYPSNICDVVKQSRVSGALHRCQFSWYCDGKADAPYDPKVWRDSLKIAAAVLQKDSAIPIRPMVPCGTTLTSHVRRGRWGTNPPRSLARTCFTASRWKSAINPSVSRSWSV